MKTSALVPAQPTLRWYVISFLCWSLDWLTTALAISLGAIEANPFAAHFHGIIGIHLYAVVLFPLLAVRAYMASQQHQSIAGKVARIGARVFIVFHVLVVLNNFHVLSSF